MQPDLEVMNRIVVGHPAENPTLLTSHDWHTEDLPPWHQKHIRAGLVNNGWWALDVAEAGTYEISLYRWPPSLNLPYNAEVPAGNPVPGGEPYAEGQVIALRGFQIWVNDQQVAGASAEARETSLVVPGVELEAGHTKLRTRIDTDDPTEDLGAYYVTVERIK